MQPREILGLDLGQSKTGLARASTTAKIAEPLRAVPTEELTKTLRVIIEAEGVVAVVVGLPRGLDGQETEQTRWVRDWTAQAKADLAETAFYFQDEALTSALAAEAQDKGISEDALAAQIILQDFLDNNEAAKYL